MPGDFKAPAAVSWGTRYVIATLLMASSALPASGATVDSPQDISQAEVLTFFGVTPGQTTIDQMLANEQWGAPVNRVPTGEGLTRFEFQVSRYRVWATSDSESVIQAIDVALPAGAQIAPIVEGFRLGDPLPDTELPREAQIGLRPENDWRPQLYSGGRVILFLREMGNDRSVARLRFFGKPQQPLPASLQNSIEMQFVLIPAGEFSMGSRKENDVLRRNFPAEQRRPDEWPAHAVTISRPFYIGQHEVTRGQFRTFAEESGYKTDAERKRIGDVAPSGQQSRLAQQRDENWQRNSTSRNDNEPVIYVSWNDAVAFCEWLSRREGATYRLPTEAEWEYVARGGTESMYWFGDDSEQLADVGNTLDATARKQFTNWTSGIRASDGYAQLAPVGSFRPNPFGVFDVHGNVWEWVSDWYDQNYYGNSPAVDPQGPPRGLKHVFRGGCWY
jgi:sulfatase modifying factor 1